MIVVPIWYFVILGFLFGASVGSFYNVLIYRMPRGLSLVKPASFCPSCKKHIPIFFNLPLVGWLLLRGKSACCKSPISVRYPLVELLCALLGALSVVLAEWGRPWGLEASEFKDMAALSWLLLGIVPVLLIDLEHHLIPDSISVGGIFVGLLLSIFPGGISVVDSLLGFLIAGGGLYVFGFLVTRFLKKEAMGFGDVKLLAGYGAIMGYFAAFEVLVMAALLGLLVILPMRFIKRPNGADFDESSKEEIPFGPFLSISAPIVYLWGDAILELYLSFIY